MASRRQLANWYDQGYYQNSPRVAFRSPPKMRAVCHNAAIYDVRFYWWGNLIPLVNFSALICTNVAINRGKETPLI